MVKKDDFFSIILKVILPLILFIIGAVLFAMSIILTEVDKKSEEEKQMTIERWVEREAVFQKEKKDLIKSKDVLIEYFTVEEIDLGQAVIDEIIRPEMNEYQKVKAIYDYIVHNVSYDYEALETGMIFVPEVQEPIGALRDGKAVCGGYAHTMELLCVLADVDCIYVVGLAGPEGQRDPESDYHAWNKVKIDGQWYNVDATWSKTGSGGQYFLVSDNSFYIDHEVEEPLVYFIPESPEGY